MESIAIVKVLFLTTLSFVVTVILTPLLTHFLYQYKLGKNIHDDRSKTPIVATLHKHKRGTPTMGGVLIWGTTLLLSVFFLYATRFFPDIIPPAFNFLTRSETLLPLGVLISSAIVGLIDDLYNIRRKGGGNGGGLKISHRLMMYSGIAIVGAWWFYVKLDWTILRIPFIETPFIEIGWWMIPLFILTIVATSFSVNETDGLDGLAGGVLLSSFSAYAAIAFVQGRFNLAAFCGVIAGALLAFLWFNIYPARFMMGDTGAMSLGVTLGVVAMLTNTLWLLPLIGFILVIESASVIFQVASKKFRHGKKVFLAAPLHHHFEAIGWPEPKIVMRFWIISCVMGVLGLVLFLIDRSFLV